MIKKQINSTLEWNMNVDRKRDEEERLKLTMAIEQATISFLMTDENRIIEYVNPAFEKTTGYSSNEAIGQNISFLKSELTSEKVYDELWKVVMNGETWEGELINKRKDGSIYYAESKITPVLDINGELISILSIKQDITERKELEEKLMKASIMDSLTNIYNRRYVFEVLEQMAEVYKRKGDNFSVDILDIDFFKKVNDTFGHPAGDFILQEFARIIGEGIRSSDILGRHGGEEFIILFTNCNKQNSKIVVDKILKRVRNTIFKYDENEIRFTFSAGISDALGFDINKFSHENLIKSADERLYEAKNTGRNKIVID